MPWHTEMLLQLHSLGGLPSTMDPQGSSYTSCDTAGCKYRSCVTACTQVGVRSMGASVQLRAPGS